MEIKKIREQLLNAYQRLEKVNISGLSSAEQMVIIGKLLISIDNALCEKEEEHGENKET